MSEFEYIWNEVQNPSVMKQFESDLGSCFFSESARIKGHNISLYVTQRYLIFENDEHLPEDADIDDRITFFLDADCISADFYDNCYVTHQISYDITEEEFLESRFTELFTFKDVSVLKNFRIKFKDYL